MENRKFYCNGCNYGAEYKTEFDKHLKTARHKRGGKRVDYNCKTCDYKALNTWNLRVHETAII
jgi:hypothetical protein